MPKTTTNQTTPPAFDLNQAMADMSNGKKKPALLADTRDLFNEGVRFTKSLMMTATLASDVYRAEEYAEMDPKTLNALVAMRSHGM
jgi:hypothetical protein